MIASLLVLLSPAAVAGERFFAWSYGTDTVPKGGVEMEPISTVETHDEGGELVAEWTHEVELETGITDALEGGVYIVASQTNADPLTFAGYKVRVRYRFWPVGTRAIDMAGYLEYIGNPTFDEHGIEAKLILAHEGEKFRASLNLTVETMVSDAGAEPTLEPTLGVAWRANPHLALGAEGKVEAVFGTEVEGPYFWAGPTVHLAGSGGKIWWTGSAMYGLTENSRADAAVEARSMIGIQL